jgi:hypothetical protein
VRFYCVLGIKVRFQSKLQVGSYKYSRLPSELYNLDNAQLSRTFRVASKGKWQDEYE